MRGMSRRCVLVWAVLLVFTGLAGVAAAAVPEGSVVVLSRVGSSSEAKDFVAAARRQVGRWEGGERVVWVGEDGVGEASVSLTVMEDERAYDRAEGAVRLCVAPEELAAAEGWLAVLNRFAQAGAPLVRLEADASVEAGEVVLVAYEGAPLSRKSRAVRLVVYLLLDELGVMDGWPVLHSVAEAGQRRVAIYDCKGIGKTSHLTLRRALSTDPAMSMEMICPEDIREGALGGFDVVMFPGGSGKGIGTSLGVEGRARVKAFIEGGGGYYGVCAGAYLATCRLDSYLSVVKAYHQQPWAKGKGYVQVELTEAGAEFYGADEARLPRRFSVRYANGPILNHENGSVPDVDLPDYEVLMRFRTAVKAESEEMVDEAAAVRARFGEGRIVLMSPHPESSSELDWVTQRAVVYLAEGE